MDQLYPGRIFWKADQGPRGKGKSRPMIIISRWKDIARTGQIQAIVCSTSISDPPQECEVELPFREDGFGDTKLRRRTVAVCNWPSVTVSVKEVTETGGMVSPAILKEICAKAGFPFPAQR